MALNFHKICRTCMEESSTLLQIFDKPDLNDPTSITAQLKSFTSLLPAKNDDLPQHICFTCLSEINRANLFKQKCERSDYSLRIYLQQTKHQQFEQSPESSYCLKNEPDTMGRLIADQTVIAGDDNEDGDEVCSGKDVDRSECLVNEKVIHYDDNVNYESDKLLLLKPNEEDVKDLLNLLYQCQYCNDTFSSNSELELHLTNGHSYAVVDHSSMVTDANNQNESDVGGGGGDVLLDSSIEDNNLFSSSSYIINSQPSKTFNCQECKASFTHKTNLKKHIKTIHTIKEEQSDPPPPSPSVVVSIISTDKEQYRHHQQQQTQPQPEPEQHQLHPKPIEFTNKILIASSSFKCSKCGARFVKEKSLNIHQKSNKCMEKSFECHYCKRIFIRRNNLKMHLLIHTSEKEFSCTKCNKEFRRADQLKYHEQNHTKSRKHQCSHCPKSFNMLSTLKDHLRTHNGERPFLCSVCGKGFSQSTNLRQHMMRHSNIKPYKCTECSQTFVSKGELDAHLRKHTGDHPFVCDVCGTGFTTSSSLAKHKRIHTGERPYACEYCPMRFTALGTLKNHRRTHTGERPFACSVCGRTFTQRSDCVSHERTHTEGRAFSCKQCPKSFQHNSALKAHMKIHNSENLTIKSSGSTPEVLSTLTMPSTVS